MIERKARIFNIQKYNMYDGPGIRTLVFFKGCPLRCKWCSNPEGQRLQYQVLFKQSFCIHCGACVSACPTGTHRFSTATNTHTVEDSGKCVGCRQCEEVCPANALAVVGEEPPISSLLDIIEEDRPFYDTSGGGVTLGGGDPLMQPEAATNLLMACGQNGFHTAIETSGYAKQSTLQKVAQYTDLFLYDVKHMDSDKHYACTGVRNELILSNLTWLLENRHAVKIRVALLKGVNDSSENFRRLAEFLKPYQDFKNFKGIDLLPYHKMGINKYSQLGLKYPFEGDPTLDDADLKRVEGYARDYGFFVSLICH